MAHFSGSDFRWPLSFQPADHILQYNLSFVSISVFTWVQRFSKSLTSYMFKSVGSSYLAFSKQIWKHFQVQRTQTIFWAWDLTYTDYSFCVLCGQWTNRYNK